MSRSVILALCLGTASASSGFSNVSHLTTTTIAFGSSTNSNGQDAFFPASNGNSVGVFESTDGGATLKYDSGVGETAEAMILMATAVRDVEGEPMSVIVGGLFGAAISYDSGAEWAKLNASEVVTQDIKYEGLTSGLYALTGESLGQPGALISSDGGASFDMVKVSGLYQPYVRYGSFPSTQTFYMTAGSWGDDSDVEDSKRISARLSLSEKGELIRHEIKDTNTTGYWAQVAKTTDGGATWTIVFEDFESNRYPNDISCSSENTCVFVMEGEGVPQIISTQDGGATWTVYNDESGGVSLMAVRMVGATEAWVAGGGDTGRMWHSTDLVEWTAYTTDISDAAEIMSFAFNADQSVAFASGVLRSQLCSVLKLEF